MYMLNSSKYSRNNWGNYTYWYHCVYPKSPARQMRWRGRTMQDVLNAKFRLTKSLIISFLSFQVEWGMFCSVHQVACTPFTPKDRSLEGFHLGFYFTERNKCKHQLLKYEAGNKLVWNSATKAISEQLRESRRTGEVCQNMSRLWKRSNKSSVLDSCEHLASSDRTSYLSTPSKGRAQPSARVVTSSTFDVRLLEVSVLHKRLTTDFLFFDGLWCNSLSSKCWISWLKTTLSLASARTSLADAS